MASKARPENTRDVTMLSGLVLFLGFIALGWATVATFGKDYPQSVSAALLGIGLMLAGIGIRLKLLAPAPEKPETPSDPEPDYGDPDGKPAP